MSMDTFGNMMPIISQLISQLTVRDRGQQSRAELEVMVRSVVSDCLQQQAATERREMVNSLMDVVKESIARPAETRRNPNEEMQSQKQIIMEVLQEVLKDQKSGKSNSRGRTRESANSNNFVLPWCDNPGIDSQSKSDGKGKQPSEKKGSVNESEGKSFNKDKRVFEKKGFDEQRSKNFQQGRGRDSAGRGGNRQNFSQEKFHKDNVKMDGAVGPTNYMPYGGSHGYGANQNYNHHHHQKQGQQEGAMGYGHPNPVLHQRSTNNQMPQQPFGTASPPGNYNNQPNFLNNYQTPTPNNYQPGYQPGPANYNYQPGMPNHNYPPSGTNPPGPVNYNYHHNLPNQNYHPPSGANNYQSGPSSQNVHFNQAVNPRQQFGNAKLSHQNSSQFSNQVPHQPIQHGGNGNAHPLKSNFNAWGNNFRGRGAFQRGGYQNRGGNTNKHEKRGEQRGNNAEIHTSLTDLTALLSPEEVTTIRNVLKSSDTNGAKSKSNKNQVAFKQKKNNMSGKPNAEENDEQDDEDVKSLSTNENKVLEDKLPGEVLSKGAKKKKNASKTIEPEGDQRPKEADESESSAASARENNLKLLVGLGINKDVLKNVDANQEIKHVVLIARCGDETKTFQPKNIGEFKTFMEKYPKAEAIIVREK